MRPTLRSALLAPLVGGTLLVLVPAVLASPRLSVAPAPQGVLGALLVVAGLVVVVSSIREFAVIGHGTPLPIDPPRQLVTSGPYHYVRNPMALGFVTTIVGEAALLDSRAPLVYAVLALAALHVLVIAHEEPANRRRFGEEYEAYRRAVRRWIPGASRPGRSPGLRASGHAP